MTQNLKIYAALNAGLLTFVIICSLINIRLNSKLKDLRESHSILKSNITEFLKTYDASKK